MNIVEKVSELIESDLNKNGYRISSIEYVKEGSVYFLRVVIDKDGIIDIDDCVKASEIINPILDSNEPISDSYMLDVCSKEKGSE